MRRNFPRRNTGRRSLQVCLLSAVLLSAAQVASALDCYVWHIDSGWLTADGTDPETLAYDSLKGGFTGPDHPNSALGPASCTIDGDPSAGPAHANCTLTVSCG